MGEKDFPFLPFLFFREYDILNGMKNLYLIGLPGVGKTCIGRIVAKKNHCRFIDTDTLIETRSGMTVAEIFDREGENGFRQRETDVLKELASLRSCVVSTGGGIVEREENIDRMRNSGTVIWLKRDLRKIIDNPRMRLRPLLAKDPEALFDLMEKREPLYKKASHFTVSNDSDNRMDAVWHIMRIIK